MELINVPTRERPQYPNLKRGGSPKKTPAQEPGPRMQALLAAHGVEKILKAAKDHDFLNEHFSAYDALLIVALANSLNGNETAIENRLNRMFGKVPDKQINLNLNIDASPSDLSDKACDLLESLGVIEDDNYDLVSD